MGVCVFVHCLASLDMCDSLQLILYTLGTYHPVLIYADALKALKVIVCKQFSHICLGISISHNLTYLQLNLTLPIYTVGIVYSVENGSIL